MKLEEGMKCPICGGGVLEHTRKEHEVEHRGVKKILADMDVFVCTSCEDGFYSRSSERRLNITFTDMKRAEKNLLLTEEIKSIRKGNGLTQEELSSLLGMAPKTIARYENGTIVQSRSTDVLLRLLRDNPSNMDFLGNYLLNQHQSQSQQITGANG